MAGIVVESKDSPSVQCLQGSPGGHNVKGDLSGMNFQRKSDSLLLEDIQNRVPELGELPESVLNLCRIDGGKGVKEVPDPAPNESSNNLDTEAGRRRAVAFISSAALSRTPAGSPSPQTWGGSMERWRWSIRSQTAWPTR